MNPSIAKVLLLFFFLSVGSYHLVRGILNVRSERESNLWGWVRIVFGALVLLLPIPFLFLLRIGLSE